MSVPSRLSRFFSRYGRTLFILLGFSVLVYLVLDTGPGHIASVLLGTSHWLWLILFLEAAWISFDTWALMTIYGSHRRLVPPRAWLRSALVAYTMMILLPAGRAGGEIARGSILSRWAGSVAVQRSTQLQCAVLLGNSVVSFPCALAVGLTVGPWHPLTLLVAGNGVATAVLGVGLSLVLKRSGVGRWLERRFPNLSEVPGVGAEDIPWVPWKGTLLTSMGRAVQVIQYGIILASVGGALTVRTSLVSEAIHLVGAGLGDFVPNAVGITEGAYRVFASALGMAEAPAKALSIALIGRFAQISMALLALLGTAALGSVGEIREASSPHPRSAD